MAELSRDAQRRAIGADVIALHSPSSQIFCNAAVNYCVSQLSFLLRGISLDNLGASCEPDLVVRRDVPQR